MNPVTVPFEDMLRARMSSPCFPISRSVYLNDPRGGPQGVSGLIVAPEKVADVSFILARCNDAQIPVIPFGGGTGLVRGQLFGEPMRPVILSLERLNKIRGIYPSENVMSVEAGVTLADARREAERFDRTFPLSLASEGTAQVGGNLATNAGGVHVLRYGSARNLCLGIEAVLPNGKVMNGLSRLRKDNTGYDVKSLMIGSEGTLGIITAASLSLVSSSTNEGTAFFSVPSPKAAVALFVQTQFQIGDNIRAFELIHRQGLEFLKETVPQTRLPFSDCPDWTVLMDIGVPRSVDPQALLIDLYEDSQKADLVGNAIIARSQKERDQFWSVRENIPEANRRIGSVSSHDISVPLSAIPDFLERAQQKVAEFGDLRINCFGHIGDGNLHYNVFPAKGKSRKQYHDIRGSIRRAVYELVNEFGGSISAEHGIGRQKVAELERFGDATKLALMREIKNQIDPNGIMNPGALFSCAHDVNGSSE
ncbi:MAG: FAD-binding oxidoreductase [Aestuariivita sp.]|nr:FAD-binding oxidoreductase [Aestuariivita sp.]